MSNVYKINNVGGTTDLVEPLILGFEQTYPLSYSAWGAWLGATVHGVAKSQTQLSN